MKLLLLLSAMTVFAVSLNAHPWPVWPDSVHHQIMQLYGLWFGDEDQSSPPGMHNGDDIVVPFMTPVYAVQSGYVKAVLTIVDEVWSPVIAASYWRIVIADSSGIQPCDGWMYAHVDKYSIAVTVGQWVQVGDSLGCVASWYNYDFPSHLHLSEVHYYGTASHWTNWNGWEFVGNPLDEIDNVNDTIPPVLQTAYNSQLLAFCANETSNYFEEGAALSGDVDVICRAYDNHNWDSWKNIPYSLEYSISGDSSIPWTNSVRFSQAFGTYDDYAMYTYIIFKDDNICNSVNDSPNNGQKFYFALTNTDGDTITEISDSQAAWQTANFHNGQYIIRVKANDRSWNSAVDSMTVSIANYFTLSGHVGLGDGNPYPAGTIVTAVSSGKIDTTDAAGNYSIPLVDGGSQMITFSRPGYATIDTVVMMNQERQIDVVLALGVFLCGDANNDNVVNIRDITFLINFLYKSGPPPLVFRSLDVNSDSIVNIRDVTYLINYLYKSGPNPDCPF